MKGEKENERKDKMKFTDILKKKMKIYFHLWEWESLFIFLLLWANTFIHKVNEYVTKKLLRKRNKHSKVKSIICTHSRKLLTD